MGKSKGKSIVIFSAKGGVGKTTTAINLAGVFSLFEKKVLIIDFDLTGGGIATYLNKPFKKSSYNFIEDYTNNRFQNIAEYATQYNDFIYFLPTDKDPRNSVHILPSHVDLILEKALYEYDVVIVDTNHILSEFNITLMDICDEVLMLVSNDLLDFKNMRNVIKIFTDAEKTNFKVMLNESVNPYRKYYSIYDIKNTIKANIDYTLPSEFFLKTMPSYVSDGIILTLDKRFVKAYPKVNKTFNAICNDLLEVEDEK